MARKLNMRRRKQKQKTMRIFDLMNSDFWNLDLWSLPSVSNGFNSIKHYKVYDPERFELKEKESYKEKLKEAKQKRIKELDEEIERLKGEIKSLKE